MDGEAAGLVAVGPGIELGVAPEVGRASDGAAPDADCCSVGAAAPGSEAALSGGGGGAASGTAPAPLPSGVTVATDAPAASVAVVETALCPSRSIRLSSECSAPWT